MEELVIRAVLGSLISLVASSVAFAAPRHMQVSIRPVCFRTDCSNVDLLHRQAGWLINRNTRARVSFGSLVSIHEPREDLLTLGTRSEHLDATYFTAKASGVLKSFPGFLSITNPLKGSGKFYTGGIARGICRPRNGQAEVNLAHNVSPSTLENQRALRVTAHEMLHLLGASHQSLFPNIMHPDANGPGNDRWPPYIHSGTRREVRNCLRYFNRRIEDGI